MNGYDESDFSGREDSVCRRHAWAFMLAGGDLLNNLDYTFTVGHEDGDDLDNSALGRAGPDLRAELKVLREFLDGYDLERMHEDTTSVAASPGVLSLALSEPGSRCTM